MKKTIHVLFAVISGLLVSATIFAQTVNTSSTATWVFDLGIAGQTASFSDATAAYFSQNYVSVGSNLAYKDARIVDNTYTRFQPFVQNNNPTEADIIGFNLRPKTGLSFVPTSVAFECMRYGTDGGFVDVAWKSSNGTITSLATAIKPARDNTTLGTQVNLDLSGVTIPGSDGECSLLIYFYGLGNTKQGGLADIIITGNLSGTVVNIPTHTVNLVVTPDGAGTTVSNPVGSEFDEGTEITLTANKNFGYQFDHWATTSDQTISSVNPFTFSLSKDTTIKAVFTQLNTYALNLTVNGGAKDYMIGILPSGNMVDGKRMYEQGTNVALTASNNELLTFTHWSSGETNANLNVTMDQEQNIEANFSAIDFIAGWDFWVPGSGGRVADFYSSVDNETASLVLRLADGTSSSWLDKSQMAAGGYEGRPAAVNWKPLTDHYYYQISFNAKDFENIKVASSMLFNYNAYSVQNLEYSVDGENFTKLGEIVMTNAKAWNSQTVTLPTAADHADKVYFRWIPDYTSAIVGAASTNDGTALNGIYVTADAVVYNDGIAPVLLSSVPADQGNGASTTGKVVLTFDEKVQVKAAAMASLNGKNIPAIVSGKTITFSYVGLDYNSNNSFYLAAGIVSDLAGNALTDPISIHFNTMDKPKVSKKAFDFIVGKDGDFKAALTAASAASASGNRFRVFVPNGSYNIGSLTGDANQMTTVSIPNVSFIGESADGVILYNKSIQESINSTATLYFTDISDNIYMQDISLLNKMDYRTGTLLGRGVALWDKGNKNIYKNVKLLSNQDTYYTGGDRSYLETCEIHGTVDFICGGGDIFFNECLLYMEERSGNCLTAPASNGAWGYVFSNCTIDGFPINNGSYRLGRPWSNAPKSVFLNTTMKVLPTTDAWGDPMNVVPAVFAEYNSMTASGTPVDLSNRRSVYTKDATTVTLNPVLSSEQAATYTIDNVVGGTDNWLPKLHTDQASAPHITGTLGSISWSDNDYVLCWAIFKNGQFVEFTTLPEYSIPAGTPKESVFTVRAANEMGGLGMTSNVFSPATVGTENIAMVPVKIINTMYFTIEGKQIHRLENFKGVVMVKTRYENGLVTTSKMIRTQD